jgi:hypothetical protein
MQSTILPPIIGGCIQNNLIYQDIGSPCQSANSMPCDRTPNNKRPWGSFTEKIECESLMFFSQIFIEGCGKHCLATYGSFRSSPYIRFSATLRHRIINVILLPPRQRIVVLFSREWFNRVNYGFAFDSDASISSPFLDRTDPSSPRFITLRDYRVPPLIITRSHFLINIRFHTDRKFSRSWNRRSSRCWSFCCPHRFIIVGWKIRCWGENDRC